MGGAQDDEADGEVNCVVDGASSTEAMDGASASEVEQKAVDTVVGASDGASSRSTHPIGTMPSRSWYST